MVAQIIQSDPQSYSDVVLGYVAANSEPSTAYTDKLLRPTTWGGAIELSAFSTYFGVEIRCWDVKSGVCNRFGEDRGYSMCWMLVYSGIHYDALHVHFPGAGTGYNTLFPTAPDAALEDACNRLITALRSQH